MSSDRDQIKQILQEQIETLCRDLLPDGTRNGRYWIARNPSRDDRKAGSFYVWLTGVPGGWRDDATGEKGDVFQLIALVEKIDIKTNFGAVLEWSRKWLRLDGLSPPERQQRVEHAETKAKERAAGEIDLAEKNIRRAQALYFESKSRTFLGSPADRYLQSRGVNVKDLGRKPGALGWLPDAKLRETGQHWPCLVAGITGPDERIVSVHRTFLEPDGSDKLSKVNRQYFDTQSGKWDEAPARKIWPSFKGGAIRLWRGESKLSIGQAIEHGLIETLLLCEGVEDGLSMALARPDLRVWCAGSLGNLRELVMPACIDRVIINADNDWGKPQAQRQFDEALAALTRQGLDVSVARSPIGKDANDALRMPITLAAPELPKAGRFA
jgi:hypothetical protein